MLPPDVESFIERTFAAPDRDAARTLYLSAVIHDGSSAGPRLVRCALVSSRGSLERLRGAIEHLKIDFRDVIVEGEYESRGGRLVRVRDLNAPIGEDL